MLIEGLYVIINRVLQGPEELILLCQQVLEGGANVIQLRNKSVLSQEVIHLAEVLFRLCRNYRVPFLFRPW